MEENEQKIRLTVKKWNACDLLGLVVLLVGLNHAVPTSWLRPTTKI